MQQADETNDEKVIKDSNGNILADGDAVMLIKDLKVRGSSITLKMGTKVKSIRLVDGDHEVDCKTDMGQFMLKACFLKRLRFKHVRLIYLLNCCSLVLCWKTHANTSLRAQTGRCHLVEYISN